MNITYTQNGDYLIPNIVIRKTKPLGHYGRLRKAYLKMHRPILFNELVLSDKLFEHCAEIDEAARNRIELIVRSLARLRKVSLSPVPPALLPLTLKRSGRSPCMTSWIWICWATSGRRCF